jgi:heme o synthase
MISIVPYIAVRSRRIGLIRPLLQKCRAINEAAPGAVYRSFSSTPASSSANTSSNTSSRGSKRPKIIPSFIVDYASLSKLRLSSLVVLTTGAGYICASSPIDMISLAYTCFGTFLCASSAATFNQVIEKDNDAAMNRTKARPLPTGRVPLSNATAWGIATGLSGTAILYSLANPVVAALGLANIVLYAGPYTYLKKHSEINTWVGSLVGAIPPVMGWASATGGSICSLEPLAMGSILFLWQFPHFFALSYLHREDYARGGFQMVATNDPTGSRSANLVMNYSIYLSVLPIITTSAGLTSMMFAVEGTAVNAYLLYLAHKFQSDHSNSNAKRIFLYSLLYLPILLGAYVLHSNHFQSIDNEQSDKVGTAIISIGG